MKLPKARKNIIVQNFNDEILAYDLENNRAHCLNETAGKVFNACDGRQTLDDLKRRHKFTDEIVFLALDALKKENLLDEETEYVSSLVGMNRREAIRKVGLGTMLALPVITTLLAPKSAAAASCRAQACTFDNFAQSNCCNGSRCNNVGACENCLGSGQTFFQFGSGTATCDTRPEKNRCCNTTGTATVSGSNCQCP